MQMDHNSCYASTSKLKGIFMYIMITIDIGDYVYYIYVISNIYDDNSSNF